MGGLPPMAGMGMPGFGLPAPAPPPPAPLGPPSSCVLLKNMFDPHSEDAKTDPDFFSDLREDVGEECGKHGRVRKLKVDKTGGIVYLRFDEAESATRALTALNNRWFAGKQITADYVSEEAFDALDL